jgi:hypothetical protein
MMKNVAVFEGAGAVRLIADLYSATRTCSDVDTSKFHWKRGTVQEMPTGPLSTDIMTAVSA